MIVKLVRDKDHKGWSGEYDDSNARYSPVNSLPGKQLALTCKLHEEASEIARAPTDPAEYADLLEVMLELARLNGVPWSDIEKALLEKREARGAFRRGNIYIQDEVEREAWDHGYPTDDASAG